MKLCVYATLVILSIGLSLFFPTSAIILVFTLLFLAGFLYTLTKQRWNHVVHWFFLALVLVSFLYVGLLVFGIAAPTLGLELCIGYSVCMVFYSISYLPSRKKLKVKQ